MQRLDLRGLWQLSKLGCEQTIPAQVPGDTHSALVDAGRIPDPYWGTNELAVQWVGREDWVYSRTFDIAEDFLKEESIFLNCDRLDTITDIYINNQHVGSTDNMFRRYRFEVKNFLQPGTNELRTVFHSAERVALERSRNLPYEIPHAHNPIQSPHINLSARCPAMEVKD